MLCFGLCVDGMDEYCRTSESIAQECLGQFCIVVRVLFETHYMCQPTRADFDKKVSINEARGNLHIWHAFFDLPRSNNDLNVLGRSLLVHNLLTSEAGDM